MTSSSRNYFKKRSAARAAEKKKADKKAELVKITDKVNQKKYQVAIVSNY